MRISDWSSDVCSSDLYGVALCGSGIGISIAVNRNPACRCALVNEPLSAALAREHNDANVIALGARLIGEEMARACITRFLETDFAGGRHHARVDKLALPEARSEEHTSELQSLMRTSYAVFFLTLKSHF